ncbi:acyl-CoA thioesterase [Ornithinimicrobium cerasi]|uniref:Acyl-CoA thioesterase-2 n=1 Tax=Ornithinimicrobium cerasi TaxID=2248773 RepID=A0A285VF53_9MICO|nr:acyl-CoA thioesterase II [Ornithinimicrobium cerasi]SOC52597.1 acyl-CoA thioesterase-2 [Ornithinimicrobium cerasi]
MSDAPLTDPADDLLDVLDLTYEGSTTIQVASPTEATGDLGVYGGEVFTGRSQPQPHGRVFGGQVLAQCVVAAGRTVAAVDDGGGRRHIHSLHGYFLRPGDASKEIQFVVEGMRDGGSFSARRVHATQEGRILLSLITSFQEESGGLEHHLDMPDVPGPEELRSDREILEQIDHPVARHFARYRAVDLRHTERLLLGPAEPGPAAQSVWMRVEKDLPDDDLLHAAILAYASDYVLLEPVLRTHGVGWGDPRLRAASLDHAMWFHRPARVDEWVLYTQSSPSAQSGRGLGLGHMFAADGTLLATVGQEGMVRLKA